MLTPKQESFHWRLWGDVCDAHSWCMRKGRLVHDAARLNEMGRQVWPVAEQLAAREHRAVTLDDLRHAAYAVAIGQHKSHSVLSNAEFNRVILVFKLLIDWDNLDAQMDWLNAENAERRSFAAFLRKKAPEAVIATISNNAFGTRHWQDLPIQRLRWIASQLKDRRDRWDRKVERKSELRVESSDPVPSSSQLSTQNSLNSPSRTPCRSIWPRPS